MNLDPKKYPKLSSAMQTCDYLDRLHLSNYRAGEPQITQPRLNEIEVVVNKPNGKQYVLVERPPVCKRTF